jgi:hypothetical protein
MTSKVKDLCLLVVEEMERFYFGNSRYNFTMELMAQESKMFSIARNVTCLCQSRKPSLALASGNL